MESTGFLHSNSGFAGQIKQSFSGDRKKLFSILGLVILLLGIPLAVWLLQKAQIFAPRADVKPIELITGENSCVISTDPNKASCASFPIKLTSPLGPPKQGGSCTSDNDCPAGDKCFNYQTYPGTCRPSDTTCAAVITTACHERSTCTPEGACTNVGPECVDFPSPCHVPPGWTIGPRPAPSACSTNAAALDSTVVSNREIKYTLTYPAGSKITKVDLPATPGYAFKVNNQTGASGAALAADLGQGAETVVITVTADANKACAPFTINYTLTNSCGTTFPRFLGPGSTAAWGTVCQASPSPSPSAAAVCSTNATGLGSSVVSNKQITYTLTYPSTSKITKVSMPATPGYAFNVNGQTSASGAALNADLGAGAETVSITVIADAAKACAPFTISYNLTNSCGTTFPRFLGPGSTAAWGTVCTNPTPTPTTGVSSGTDELGVNLQAAGSCVNGAPVITFSNGARADTNNFNLYKNGQVLPYDFAGIYARPPTQQMKDTAIALGSQNYYYIQAKDGPMAGKKSNTITITAPTSCAAASAETSLFAYINNYINRIEALANGFSFNLATSVNAQAPALAFNPDPGGGLSTGLLSYYKFDETTGSAAADSKNANNSTATGTTIVDGKIIKGRQFGAAADKIATNNVNLNLSDLTITGWIQPTGTGPTWNLIASQWGAVGTTNASWNFSYSTDYKLHFHPVNVNCTDTLGAITTPAAAVTPVANKWYFVAVTRSAATGAIIFYVDGSPIHNATSGTGPLCKTSLPIVFGQFPWDTNQRMVGKLDEVGIWNRVLTAQEITSLYNGGQGNTYGTVTASTSPSASASTACPNLVKNDSFESPIITLHNGEWQLYGQAAADANGVTENIPDWDPRTANSGYQIELHHLFGDAADGKQHAEIDVPGVISLTQSLPTKAGQQYQIKFSYSSRPGMPAQKMGVYWNGQEVGTVEGAANKTALEWQEKTFTVTGIDGNSKLGFGALAGSPAGGGNLIDKISVTQTGACAASPLPSPQGTLYYKMAETEAGLQSAPAIPYTEHPTITNFAFKDTNWGSKQIWVQFIGPNNSSTTEHISVDLIEPEPKIASLDCTMDISRKDLKLTLNGSLFGGTPGKVTANSKEAQILAWNANQITATIKPTDNLEDGKLFKIVMTRADGKALPETTCLVNTSVLSLGARLFCREPGQFDVNAVKVTLVDEAGNKVNEDVTIDREGLIKGLKTKLQVGKKYAISIKAPNSLRRNAEFTAANGTNIITPEDNQVFVLPVGDIAPVILPDGKINTLDRSEIVRQWSTLGAGSNKTGDFNKDTKVNSIDWACMRYDFNKEDDAIPAKLSSSPTPGPSGKPIPCPTPPICPAGKTLVHGDPAVEGLCPAYACLPNGPTQKVAFLLLTPEGAGVYGLNKEFALDINIWSDNEAANLFKAKLKYDPAYLEVVRIEKGTALPNWVEDFFDNSSGIASLTAGIPSPGLKTSGSTPLMGKVIFKTKKYVNGSTQISLTPESRIYSNSDNKDMLGSLVSLDIAIPFPPD